MCTAWPMPTCESCLQGVHLVTGLGKQTKPPPPKKKTLPWKGQGAVSRQSSAPWLTSKSLCITDGETKDVQSSLSAFLWAFLPPARAAARFASRDVPKASQPTPTFLQPSSFSWKSSFYSMLKSLAAPPGPFPTLERAKSCVCELRRRLRGCREGFLWQEKCLP